MSKKKLTRGTIKLISEAIEATGSTDRYELCYKITEIAIERYDGMNLDYQLKRMGLTTTKKILDAIDLYFYKYANNLKK